MLYLLPDHKQWNQAIVKGQLAGKELERYREAVSPSWFDEIFKKKHGHLQKI